MLGQMTIHGNILPLPSIHQPLQAVMDSGAKKVVIPVENKRHLTRGAGRHPRRRRPIFYADPLTAALKACGLH
ncbi:MAG: hypothetical protein C4306_06145 [Thermoleophilia bacterium]